MMTTSADADYDELFRREHRSIVHAAFLVIGDQETAREVAQDAFAELYARWGKVSRYDKPGAWVRRVAIRRAVKIAKREQRRPRVEASESRPIAGDPVSLDTLRALDELSPTQRAVVVLHYFQDLPVNEVAELVGCKPSTASVHLSRARTRLAELLGEEVETHAS